MYDCELCVVLIASGVKVSDLPKISKTDVFRELLTLLQVQSPQGCSGRSLVLHRVFLLLFPAHSGLDDDVLSGLLGARGVSS